MLNVCCQTQNIGGSCDADAGYHLSSLARWQNCGGTNAVAYFTYPQSQVIFPCLSVRFLYIDILALDTFAAVMSFY